MTETSGFVTTDDKELHHARLSNNIVRPLFFLHFAGQIFVGQLLPLLLARTSPLLPKTVLMDHRVVMATLGVVVVAVLLIAAIYKAWQFWAAVCYAAVKFGLAVIVVSVDPSVAAYFFVSCLIGIALASTAVRNAKK